MAETNLNSMMGIALEKIRDMADADSVVGTPITAPDGTMIIPISTVKYGFGIGGADFSKHTQKDIFGGSSGAGITITPTAFIVISGGQVKIIPVESNASVVDKAVEAIPEIIGQINNAIKDMKNKKKDKSADEPQDEE